MKNISENDIAIIGMAGRFPKSNDLQEYWDNLTQGLNCIEKAGEDKLRASGIPDAVLTDKRFVNASSNIEGAHYFDPDFFGLSNAEATLMDPQIRLLLQTSWHAMEDAGYDVSRLNVPVGNFCGMSTNSYLLKFLQTSLMDEIPDPLLFRILNDKDFLATWISYKLNLTGPAFSVQTACSTSLLAVHLACQSLLNYECDMALAGGATYDSDESKGYIHVSESIYSKDGLCRAFDREASGTIMGDGVATVVLKRAEDAIRDKDHIYAVIKGTAVNNDGANKQGYTTPSVDCQRDVILEALSVANIHPETIGLLEAHGTGTLIGDPIEVAALTKAFRKYTPKQQYCAIGSVKSNIGHLDAAAGIASLIKAVFCVNKGYLVPSINFSVPNPVLELESSPFYVSQQYVPWPSGFEIRRAGVSSLGVGGTNVHVIVEEPPAPSNIAAETRPYVVVVSANSPDGLQKQQERLAQHIEANEKELQMKDLEFTTLYGRKAMPFRFSAVSIDKENLIKQLRGQEQEHCFAGQAVEKVECVFLFPGQGSQYARMAADLYQSDARFSREMDDCFDYLKTSFGLDLKPILFSDESGLLHQTEYTQIALFVVEYCLAKALTRTGIKPQALVGHSLGEYVAACIAGCLSLEDALKLVYHRGRLMGNMPTGAMLLVGRPQEELLPFLIDSVAVCAYNADDNIVFGGTEEAIEQQKALFEINNIECKKLRVSHAYHTEMMLPVLDDFRQILASVTFKEFGTPIFSTYTGEMVSPALLCTPDYWLQQIVSPVQFSAAVKAVSTLIPRPIYVEVGPGNGLSSFVKSIDRSVDTVSLLPKSARNETELFHLNKAKALLFAKGVAFDLPKEPDGHRMPLPGYRFKKKYFWKPRKDIAYSSFGQIKESYHYRNEHYRGYALRSLVEIQISDPDQFSEKILDGMDQLRTQYLESVKQLLSATDKVKDTIEVLYDEVVFEDGDTQRMDARALNTERALNVAFVAPQTPVEKTVATHWEHVLGYQPAGLLDDFFDVGGNSLLATQLINRINQNLDIDISIAEVLSSSNIKNLVQIVEEKQWLKNNQQLSNEIII